MRILLVRHGESEGNVNPRMYIEKGDSKVGLTDNGWRQVIATGGFLSEDFNEKGLTAWPIFHVSPHQRTLESLSGILHGMGTIFSGAPRVYPQAFLTEKFFGAASALEFMDDAHVSPAFRKDMMALSKAVYKNDPFQAKHLFGESSKETMMAAKLLMETIRRDMQEGKPDHVIVCHGAVIQTLLMNWLHVMPKDKNKIGNPGNGDVIEITGAPKNWHVTRIWDGEAKKRVCENLRGKLKPFTVKDLPPIPDFLK